MPTSSIILQRLNYGAINIIIANRTWWLIFFLSFILLFNLLLDNSNVLNASLYNISWNNAFSSARNDMKFNFQHLIKKYNWFFDMYFKSKSGSGLQFIQILWYWYLTSMQILLIFWEYKEVLFFYTNANFSI